MNHINNCLQLRSASPSCLSATSRRSSSLEDPQSSGPKSKDKDQRQEEPDIAREMAGREDDLGKYSSLTYVFLPITVALTEILCSKTHALMCFSGVGTSPLAHPLGLSDVVRPSDVDLAGVMNKTSGMMIPLKQDLRRDEDLESVMWCRSQNSRSSVSVICVKGGLFRLKNSACW